MSFSHTVIRNSFKCRTDYDFTGKYQWGKSIPITVP